MQPPISDYHRSVCYRPLQLTNPSHAAQVLRQPDNALLAFLLGTATGVMSTLSIVELWLNNAIENGFPEVGGGVGGGGYNAGGGAATRRPATHKQSARAINSARICH